MIRSSRTTKLSGLLAVAVALLVHHAPTPAGTHQDPKAVAVVDALEKAIAPDGGWSKVGGVRFTFSVVKNGEVVSEVHHAWDVRTGQYRVDWASKDGAERMVLFNVGAKGHQGEAYMRMNNSVADREGAPEKPAVRPQVDPNWAKSPTGMEHKLLETGYGRFINDTYWLLMPLKMRDPGVNLDYDGEKKIDKHTYDVVKLTFDNVGLTPGDTYWVYVNRETHLIDRWEYILQDEKAKSEEKKDGEEHAETSKIPERTLWIWKDWQSFGPVKLATKKTMADGNTSIVLKNVEILATMPEGEFKPPARSIPAPATPAAPAAEKPKKG